MQALAPGVVFWDLVDCPQVFRGHNRGGWEGGMGGGDEGLYIGREEGESDDRVYRERIETTMQYSEIEK